MFTRFCIRFQNVYRSERPKVSVIKKTEWGRIDFSPQIKNKSGVGWHHSLPVCPETGGYVSIKCIRECHVTFF